MTDEAIFEEALKDFNAALVATPSVIVEEARLGCDLRAAAFACRYVKPEENQDLYDRVYDIFWNHFHAGQSGRSLQPTEYGG